MKLALVFIAAAASPLLSIYAQDAKAPFSAERGKALFHSHFAGGKPETPSCATCHTDDPKNHGQTRAGKDIEPMAASANPKRFQDLEKAEKWFQRNCNSVLGRPCTAQEKGDFITFMLTQ
jgi:mono/diheme cytochrome c family protein